jgi:hypothetical protein
MKAVTNYLIVGSILLAMGLGIAGFSTLSITKQILKQSTVINQTSIGPNLSYIASTKDLSARQQLLLSLSSTPSNTPLQVQFKESNGTALAIYNITNTPYITNILTKTSGKYTLEIRNDGIHNVTISGILYSSQNGQQQQGKEISIQDNNNSSIQNLVNYGIAIVAGIALIIAGIILLIMSAIKYRKLRKMHSWDPSSLR